MDFGGRGRLIVDLLFGWSVRFRQSIITRFAIHRPTDAIGIFIATFHRDAARAIFKYAHTGHGL